MCTIVAAPAAQDTTAPLAPAAKTPYDGLVSRLVSKLLSPSTIYCQICLENVPNEEAATLITCGHAFCRGCLSGFLESAIMTSGNVYPKCFHDSPPNGACGVAITPSEIEELVSSEAAVRYRTLRLKREDESVRHCPFCDHLQAFPSGSKQRTCTCAECNGMFCFIHANAHIGMSCRKYEKQLAKRERKSTTTIKETTIPCPECDAPVEKNGGCDHIFCKSCRAGFCWRCGKAVTALQKSSHLNSCKAIPRATSTSDRWLVRTIRALRRFFSRA